MTRRGRVSVYVLGPADWRAIGLRNSDQHQKAVGQDARALLHAAQQTCRAALYPGRVTALKVGDRVVLPNKELLDVSEVSKRCRRSPFPVAALGRDNGRRGCWSRSEMKNGVTQCRHPMSRLRC